MGDEHYDDSKPTTYLQYLDMKNLYGYAMTQKLPTGFFRSSIPSDSATGYVLEVSLAYPNHLHDAHSDYALAPERKHIRNEDLSPYAKTLWKKLHGKNEDDELPSRVTVENLVTTLEDKDHYVVHYRNLRLYLQLGMEIKQIHRVLEFHQEFWMKSYIDFNTEQRKKATSFQKNFYRLMNCSVFGKITSFLRFCYTKSKIVSVNFKFIRT